MYVDIFVRDLVIGTAFVWHNIYFVNKVAFSLLFMFLITIFNTYGVFVGSE